MLNEAQKQTIIDLRQQGLAYAEIASIMELSLNTVKSLCWRSNTKPTHPQEYPTGFCKNCGKPLPETPGVKPKTFCCNQCRYSWWNKCRRKKPYPMVCQHCGRKFISFGNKKRKYCGKECCRISRYGCKSV